MLVGLTVAARVKSDLPSKHLVQMVSSPEGWGWCDVDNTWTPVWVTLPKAAKACLALLKCGCKQGCAGRCRCAKANLTQGYVSALQNAATTDILYLLFQLKACIYLRN